MRGEVFVDASAWVAVTIRQDMYHGAAAAVHGALLRDRRPLVTTNLVIAEAHALIYRGSGYRTAMTFLDALRRSLRLTKVYSDEMLEGAAEETLRRYADQDFSLTDAVSFAVMQRREIEEAFTFDRHFSTAGFTLIPQIDQCDGCRRPS